MYHYYYLYGLERPGVLAVHVHVTFETRSPVRTAQRNRPLRFVRPTV